jgi:maltose-binding protein MalE
MSVMRYSRRSVMKASAVLLGGLAVGPLLTACGGATTTPTVATAAAGSAAASATGTPAASGGRATRSLQVVQATGMVEGADTEFKRQVTAWGQANNVAVNVETAASQAMGAKISAAVNTQSGPDIILL